jgi:hypothetical protein
MSRNTTVAIAMAALLALSACGDDEPTTPTPVMPTVGGTYYANWQMQWRRENDGATGVIACYGTITLAQSITSANSATLNGFAVVSGPCPPQSFDVRGTMQANGTVQLTTGAPKPFQGQCPGAPATQYAGVVTEHDLAARASLDVNCSGEGPHHWDYILTASR